MTDGENGAPGEDPGMKRRLVVALGVVAAGTLAFVAVRRWRARPTEDPGEALVELLARLGDLLAEYQARLAGEAYLETAAPRRCWDRRMSRGGRAAG